MPEKHGQLASVGPEMGECILPPSGRGRLNGRQQNWDQRVETEHGKCVLNLWPRKSDLWSQGTTAQVDFQEQRQHSWLCEFGFQWSKFHILRIWNICYWYETAFLTHLRTQLLRCCEKLIVLGNSYLELLFTQYETGHLWLGSGVQAAAIKS